MPGFIAEAVGTFALVFAGTGAIVVNDLHGGVITHTGISLVFGMVVMGMIYSVGELSGAHLNPAVTLAFWVSGRFPGRKVPPYLLSQVLGAIAASLVLFYLFPSHSSLGSTKPGVDLPRAFLLESVMTLILMFVIIRVSTGSREQGIMAGIAIGSTVALNALFGGPVTGASMNPARSLAPALVSGDWADLWIYLTAPVLGAVLAVLLHRVMEGKRERFSEDPGPHTRGGDP